MQRRRPTARSLALVVLCALAAGCTGDDPAPADPSAGTPSPSATALLTLDDPASLRANGAAVTVGDVTMSVWPPLGLTVGEPDADGAVGLALGLPRIEDDATSTLPVGTLVAPAGATLEVLDDDSTAVRDAAGTLVAALTAPVVAGDAVGSGAVVRVAAQADGTVTWSVVRPVRTDGAVEALPAGTLTATLAATAVRSATWSVRDDEGGESLAVVPADWARRGSVAAEEAVWTQVVALAPDAGTQGMRDQLTCHMIGAPDKASWNLEPWRPEVGLLATIGALCNPE